MEIIKLSEASQSQKQQAAKVLVEAFRHMPSAWPDLEAAQAEIEEILGPNRLGFLAVEDNVVLGLIGAIKDSEFLWELHPLAVHPDYQRRGIGTLLVRQLELEASQEGICTIWLGADDDFGGTNLFGVDLYPDVLEHLMRLEVVTRHPYAFYKKMGYTLVGAIPDANGLGKPDILMAKRMC